jgi:transposase
MPVYLGIDWSQNKHDLVFLNEAGAAIARQTIPHTPAGFRALEDTRQKIEISPDHCLVALETAHNLLIDYLWDHKYSNVYVVPPSVVNKTRGRYRHSRARSDQSDAFILADLLRTDRVRFHPWRPDRPLTRQMRAKVSLIHHLTRSIVRYTNRLRAVLLRYYPAALEVFSDLNAKVTLHFIQTYPTPQIATHLDFSEFRDFALRHRYPHPRRLPSCFARLQAPQPQTSPATVLAYQDEAVIVASILLNVVQAKTNSLRELQEQFCQHPDHEIFASLPGAGKLLAPALLVKFGDDRERFPTPASVQTLAGTCPVTDQSGKRKRIKFRRACDHEFRNIAQQWAIHSLAESVWANAYWEQIRPRCRSKNHAQRCLANRWLAIAWKLWQDRKPYDEAYHLQQRALRSNVRN